MILKIRHTRNYNKLIKIEVWSKDTFPRSWRPDFYYFPHNHEYISLFNVEQEIMLPMAIGGKPLCHVYNTEAIDPKIIKQIDNFIIQYNRDDIVGDILGDE